MSTLRLLQICCFAALCIPTLPGQIISGRISGTVVDPQDAVIPGAEVSITNEATGEVQKKLSNESGYFLFPGLPPGAYTIRISGPGFSTHERKGVPLSANGSVSLGNVRLRIGEAAETVMVEAEAGMVELDNSGQSQVVNGTQMNNLMSVGRDVVSLLKILPGVSQQSFGQNASIGGSISGAELNNFSGARTKWNSVKLDGQPGQNLDQMNRFSIPVAWDAVAEVTVQPTSFLAEHGRSTGVHINVISKSGTNEFHGTGYYYKRHEQFNATNFFNNRDGLPKPLGRYNSFGGTVGGPIVKDRLFFFASQEWWRITQAAPINRTTLPTELERRGDFSQTVEQNGRLVVINDPLTRQPFPGNIIPADRISANGQAMLNVMPLPNSPGTFQSQGFNYIMQQRVHVPKVQTQFKVDWLVSSKDRISVRPRWFSQDLQGQTGVCCSVNANFDIQPHHYKFLNRAQAVTWTRTVSATMLNELSGGLFTSQERGDLTGEFDLSRYRRDQQGLDALPQLFPAANELNLIPGMQFGGVPNSPSLTYDNRTPIQARDDRFNLQDTFSWLKGTHNFKFGFSYERQYASEGPRIGSADVGGRFIFNRDANNPLDTNHPFSNAMLGVFREYRQSSRYSNGAAQMYLAEWFAQDSWRATRRLSLDYGLRISHFTDWRLRNPDGAAMYLNQHDPSQAPALYRPARDPQTGARVAQNPLTGESLPQPLIGAYVPDSGNLLNGLAVGGVPELDNGFRENPPLQFSPRVGFALDVLGTAKTVLRGGFGVYKQGIFSSGEGIISSNVVTAPPVVETPSIFFSTISGLNAARGVLFPNNEIYAFTREWRKVPTVYKWSFGIQQQLPFATLLDVAYVGNTGRHLRHSRDVNALPPGTRFQPWAIDPTTNRPLPDVFLRPIQGWQNISLRGEDVGWSNYNALQVSFTKRYSKGLQFGLAYTWSKAMGLSGEDSSELPAFTDYRTYLYGKLPFDQTHVLVLNYLYEIPNASVFNGNPVTRGLFHGWSISGISTFASGFPESVSFSYTDGVDRWGGGDAPRLWMVDNPILASGERSLERWFNTAAFAAPGRGQFGNAPRDVFRGPGINNFDLMLQKEIPVTERVRMQFRSEFYNAFNHTQFDGVDTNARFDAQGNQINRRFGQVISARNPREIQLSLRLRF